MTKNYHSDPRLKIYINRQAEDCLKELAQVWHRRDGTEMRYTDIVQLALFNLASQSDINVLPYISMIGTALKDVDRTFKDLAMLKSQYAEQILADPTLQELCAALDGAQSLLEACEREVNIGVLLSGGETTVSPDAGEFEG